MVPGVRLPAGAVPPRSRPPEGQEGVPGATGFEFAVPGIPGSRTHYHVVIPDGGTASVGLSGGGRREPLSVRVRRVPRASEAALSLKAALEGSGCASTILDPATSSACSDATDRGPAGSRMRTPPPVRVVRFRLPAGKGAAVDAALAGIPSADVVVDVSFATGDPGEPWVDAVLVERP